MRICKICGKALPLGMFYGSVKTCKRCICERNTNRLKEKQKNKYPDLPGEIWKDIVGFEGRYIVSNFGRVKSIGKKTRYAILAFVVHRQGYLRVGLSKDNHHKSYLVHRIVAEAFLPNSDKKETVNHIDGNKANNNINNLEWCTQRENNIHAHKTGLAKITIEQIKGQCARAKLTKRQVLEIKELYNQGKTLTELAVLYNVSKAQICRIVNGKSRISTLKYL